MPLAEHDAEEGGKDCREDGFNSRAPRGARHIVTKKIAAVEGFNSRAPRGARRQQVRAAEVSAGFQFTCPSRSTTPEPVLRAEAVLVSIHVPLAEHDGLIICQ